MSPSRDDSDVPCSRRTADLDRVELLYLALALGLGCAAWLALVLAELGLFLGALGAAVALFGGLAGAVWLLRAHWRLARPTSAPALVVAALLAALGAAALGRPHEYLLGGLDPGVYVDTAVHVATDGGIVWHDRDVLALSDDARRALFREPPAPFNQGSRFVGFYLTDLATARIVPQGLHLFPAVMAVGYALLGLTGLLAVPPLLALAAIGAVGLLARRLAGGAAGTIAALLLIVNPAENWFGRYPAAELAVQFALFAGLLALAVALDLHSGRLAAAAGFLVGLVHLAKVDTFVLPLAVVGVLGWLWLAGRLTRPHLLFMGGYGLVLVHAVVHSAAIATEYTYSVYRRSLPPPLVLLLLAALGLALLVLVWTVWRRERAGGGVVAAIERRHEWLWLASATAVVALGLYGWYVRPLDPWHELAGLSNPLAAVVRNRLHGLPRLGWYVPPLAILLAFAGYLGALRRLRGAAAAMLLVLVALEGVLVLSDPRITPDYPWAARRWVGILIPTALLLVAVQLAWLLPRQLVPRRIGPHMARATLPAGLALAIVAASASASAPLLAVREYAGSGAQVTRIADAVEPNAVVLFDDDLVGWRLSAPLALVGHRTAFVLFGNAGRDEALRQPLDEWRAQGRPVYWLRIGEPTAIDQWGRAWRPQQRWTTAWTEAVVTRETPPREVRFLDVPITLYRANDT